VNCGPSLPRMPEGNGDTPGTRSKPILLLEFWHEKRYPSPAVMIILYMHPITPTSAVLAAPADHRTL
jgi:hypothetical protein